jgi:hypothetical protein
VEREAEILEQTQQARAAEKIANERLQKLRRTTVVHKRSTKTEDLPDDQIIFERKDITKANKIRQEDAERQRRFAAQQADLEKPKTEWRLPIEPDGGSETEQIDRFRRDIIYHGFAFLRRKYDANPTQIKWEAARLGLNIKWDTIRR